MYISEGHPRIQHPDQPVTPSSSHTPSEQFTQQANMSSSTKPVIYIVPGAWQLPTTWANFITTAKEAGYPVTFTQLPTVGGTQLPLAALPDDVAVVQANLQKLVNEEEKEVILVGHSSGGLVASCAVEGFDAVSCRKEGKKRRGGVIQVAFLAAFAVQRGDTMLEILSERENNMQEGRDWFYLGDEVCWIPYPDRKLWREREVLMEFARAIAPTSTHNPPPTPFSTIFPKKSRNTGVNRSRIPLWACSTRLPRSSRGAMGFRARISTARGTTGLTWPVRN